MDPAAADRTFSQLDYVEQALRDAESLLKFAAETGVAVGDDIRTAVLSARGAFNKGLDEPTTANLLEALTKLAVLLSPVTPESLRVCAGGLDRRHPYRNWAIALAFVIVVYSTLSFVTSAIADSIRADIITANALAVKLNSEFPTATAGNEGVASANGSAQPSTAAAATPAQATPTALPTGLNRVDVVKDLQQYAATIRNIDAHARELSLYMHPYKYLFNPGSMDPYYKIRNNPEQLNRQFELQLPLVDYAAAAGTCTATYQRVRYFAQNLADDVLFYYGAVSSCILPALYALLGAFAYILRKFELDVSARTYVPSAADSARFVIATIGGAVVGLFSNLTSGQGIKVSPLALAFLVGYAVDVFYAFLENLIQSFTKTALAASARSSAQNSTKTSKAGAGGA
jgi:hypothetical protein